MQNDAALHDLKRKLADLDTRITFWARRVEEGLEPASAETNARLTRLETEMHDVKGILQTILDRLPPAESKA